MTTLGLVLVAGPGPVAGWNQASEWFAELEEFGCGAIWFTDHLFFPTDTPDSLTMAAVAAAATERCRVGTAVLQLPMRQVAWVAKSVATTERIAPGRVVLGVGVGEHADEYAAAGATFAARGRALEHSLSELRRLWTPSADWMTQRPQPGPIPIWVGGRAPQVLRRVATSAEGWMPMFVSPEGFARRSADLDVLLDQGQRDRSSVTRALLSLVAVTDSKWSEADARGFASSYFRVPAGAIDHHVIAGEAHHVASRIQEFSSAGVEHLAILPASPDPRRTYMTVRDAFD